MSSNRSAHDRLLLLQKRIHRSLRKQADQLLGETPEAIRRYEREYLEDFKRLPRRPRVAERSELIEEIRNSDIALIGDFHTFSQAQRTALRILRQAVREGENWFLGLEMFPSHRQDSLDRFQLGQMSEARFLEEIGYANEWGFPWAHYAPIIHWAIRNRIRLIALNRPHEMKRPGETDQNELRERDRWAAGLVTDVFAQSRRYRTKPRMAILYGELHIGRKHLPHELRQVSQNALGRPLRVLSIHQNQDSLYWKIASLGQELETEVIRLRQKNYCVLSSPPWARLQSVINWAEGFSTAVDPRAQSDSTGPFADRSTDRSADRLTDQVADPIMNDLEDEQAEMDPHSLIKQYSEIVAEFFSLPSPSCDGLHVFTIGNADFSERFEGLDLTPSMKRLLKFHVIHSHRIYIPRASIAYLASPSENGAAEIASIHLYCASTEMSGLDSEVESPGSRKDRSTFAFYRWVLEHAFGFLGSLIINPRRKCDLIADHRVRIQELENGSTAAYPHEREARELTVALLKEEPELSALDDFFGKPRMMVPLFFASRYVGFALAKQIQHSLMDGEIGIAALKKIFFGDAEGARGPSFWRFNALRAAALKGDAGTSKSERL